MGKLHDMKWTLIFDILHGKITSTVDARDRLDALINEVVHGTHTCAYCGKEVPATAISCNTCLDKDGGPW